MAIRADKRTVSRPYARLGVEEGPYDAGNGDYGGYGGKVPPGPTPTPEPGLPRDGGTRPWMPVLAVLLILAVVYFIGVGIFNFVFYPGTILNGEDVSLRPASEVGDEHTTANGSRTFQMTLGDDFAGTLTGQQLELQIDGNAFAHEALAAQNPWAWPVSLAGGHQIEVEEPATYDKAACEEAVTALVDQHNAGATAPVDATVAFDASVGAYQVVPSVAGNTLDAATVIGQVEAALDAGDEAVELTEDCYVRPKVTEDAPELTSAVQKVNGLLGATQTLTIAGSKVGEVTGEQIGGWVTLADDLSVSVDTDAISEWARGDLSQSLDTIGSRRTYQTPEGETFTVTGGTYGWNINGAELAKTIAANIQAGTASSIEVPMKQKGETYAQGTADWGSRWVDVNLSTQHAKFYDAGQVIWESDFVSGNTSEDHGTPTGVYSITKYMTSKAETGKQVKLVSPYKDENGNPTYTSYVDYWMPFIDNMVAFHDAPWRSEFGGTIYQEKGSHGCVNLPVDKAAALYGLINKGDVVVVHQ